MRSLPDMRWRLTLEAPTETPDGAGGVTTAWTALGIIPAEVIALSGDEGLRFGREAARATHRITVRAAAWGAPDRPRPDQRFAAGPRRFAIRAVLDRDGLGRTLTCLCEETPS